MYYVSTRNARDRRTAAEAIAQGLAADGGLMTPEVFPKLSHNALDTMRDMSYQQRAVYVMSAYLEDFSSSELTGFAAAQQKRIEKALSDVEKQLVKGLTSAESKTLRSLLDRCIAAMSGEGEEVGITNTDTKNFENKEGE